MEQPIKKKKPPACDRCKAKRVLCHPNPNGCPRCLEKGFECTTTPVVRRKPQKKAATSTAPSAGPPPSALGEVPSPLQSAPTEYPDFRPSQPVASTSTAAFRPPSPPSLPVPPVPSVLDPSQLSFSAAPTFPLPPPTAPLPQLVADTSNALSFPSFASSSSALILQPNPSSMTVLGPMKISPDFAQHLFHCFEQTSLFDHTIFRHLPLRPILESCAWHIDSLPPQRRILLYCALALGSLFSFSPLILGNEAHCPSSFGELDATKECERDFRNYGRRRAPRCEVMRRTVERMAKEADVAFETSVENAASCLLLDALSHSSDELKARSWLSAYMAHVRELAHTGQLFGEGKDKSDYGPVWLIHLSADVISEINAGRLTSTYADQLALGGEDNVDAEKLDQELKDTLAKGVDKNHYPSVGLMPVIYLRTARELTEKLLGTHARREPLNLDALSTFLTSLERLRSISNSYCAIVDTVLAHDPKAAHATAKLLFPHAITLPGQRRWTHSLALQGLRNFTVYSFSSLVLPLYRELMRRMALSDADTLSSSSPLSFAEKQHRDRLALAVQHVREFFLFAIEAKVEGLKHVPNVATFSTLRKTQTIDWVETLIEEVESGRVQMGEKVCKVVERLSASLKVAGYVHSSIYIDNLILRLDNHVLAFRLAQQAAAQPLSSAPTQPSLDPFGAQQFLHASFASSSYPSTSAAQSGAESSFLSTPYSAATSSSTLPSSAAASTTQFYVDPGEQLAFNSLVAIPTPSPQQSQGTSPADSSTARGGLGGLGDISVSASPALPSFSSATAGGAPSFDASSLPSFDPHPHPELADFEQTLADLTSAANDGGGGAGMESVMDGLLVGDFDEGGGGSAAEKLGIADWGLW
ncbi:hypothetical protein JCM8547_009193 [Rhodosporidiobolus lusitaniae]